MRGSRWALIILGVFFVSTLGCLPTPSVRGEIPQGNGMTKREWSTSRSLDFFEILFPPVFPVRMVSGSTSH